MVRVPASRIRKDFQDAVNRVNYQGERVVVERYGKDLVAMVSMADLELLQRLEDEADAEAAREAREEMERVGTIPLSEVLAARGR